MTTDILQAVALILQQIDATTFLSVTGPVQMTLEECIKQAALINMDTTHDLIMTCTPFVDNSIAS